MQKYMDVNMEDDMIDGLICLVTTLLTSNSFFLHVDHWRTLSLRVPADSDICQTDSRQRKVFQPKLCV